jgi:hypothetical protein
MAWPKGKPRPGNGRKKGVPNKINRDLRDMIEKALAKAGGIKYLARQADESPAAFMALLGRILPKEVAGEVKVTGEFTLVDLISAVDKRAPIQAAQPKPH